MFMCAWAAVCKDIGVGAQIGERWAALSAVLRPPPGMAAGEDMMREWGGRVWGKGGTYFE